MRGNLFSLYGINEKGTEIMVALVVLLLIAFISAAYEIIRKTAEE